ncbi:protein S100-A12 [Pogona vitticeps]|uniref:Protein S100 n=1 Tax=Pogona vitticeps TaxID=103695 RepID=A0A6J0V0G1_9SAUR|nr:protein S100-A12-like [Pogona vitticeps]
MSQTQLEACIETQINVFHQYSVRHGHFDTLSAKELEQLIQKQLPNFLKDSKNPKAIEKLFKELDQDKDKQISFGEYAAFLSRVAIASHEHIHQEGDDGHAHHQH